MTIDWHRRFRTGIYVEFVARSTPGPRSATSERRTTLSTSRTAAISGSVLAASRHRRWRPLNYHTSDFPFRPFGTTITMTTAKINKILPSTTPDRWYRRTIGAPTNLSTTYLSLQKYRSTAADTSKYFSMLEDLRGLPH